MHLKTTDEQGELNRDPQPLMRIDTFLVYPEAAKEDRLSGRVVVAALVNKQGTVDSVKIESSTNPVFNQACVDAMLPLRFLPARRDGDVVVKWYRTSMTFKPPQSNRP
jgi:TonB family protein